MTEQAKAKRGPRPRKDEKHGMAKSTEYRIWCLMKDRCNREKSNAYRWYGGRGIKVCSRWDKSFIAFYKDMGPRPKNKTLERINNNKGYSPTNCRWATRSEQNINQRREKGNNEYKWVYRNKRERRYYGTFRFAGKYYRTSGFDMGQEAHEAVVKLRKKVLKELGLEVK